MCRGHVESDTAANGVVDSHADCVPVPVNDWLIVCPEDKGVRGVVVHSWLLLCAEGAITPDLVQPVDQVMPGKHDL